MTVKTFRNVEKTRELEVEGLDDGRVVITLHRAKPHYTNLVATLTPSDIPALALAVLEAAGHSGADHSHFGEAVTALKFGVKEQARATAEAREQAELEALAFELHRASQHGRTDGVFISAPSLASLSESKRAEWLAVARRARELAQEGKGE